MERGDSAEVQSLIAMYRDPLIRYGQRILNDLDEVEDIVQEAFIRLWRDRKNSPNDAPVAPFLYKVVRNLALNRRRAVGVRSRWAAMAEDAPSASPPTPSETLAATVLSEEIELALGKLPARCREVFVLARFHGMKYGEVAEAMGISPQTVANQMTRALTSLRDELAPFLPAR